LSFALRARLGGPFECFAFRAALGLAISGATLCHEPDAHAEGESSPATTKLAAPIAGGLRLSAAVGFGSAGDDGAGVAVARLGLDGEYWLSKRFGIGGQLGYDGLTAVSFVGDWYDENRFSIAPAFSVRGLSPTNFPVLSVALGYSWGNNARSRDCGEDYDPTCKPYANKVSGLYGSLTGTWLFHHGSAQSASTAFEFGPLVRLDWLTYENSWQSGFVFQSWGWAFTAGITIGFGVASKNSE
jgi:hypothetical protein